MYADTLTRRLHKSVIPLAERLFHPERLGKLVGLMPARLNFLVVDKIANEIFAEQLDDGDFDFLQGHRLQINITDARMFCVMGCQRTQLQCQYLGHQPNKADVTLSIGSLDAIALIQQQVDPDTLFFQRKLKIKGNTELAHQLKNTLDNLDPEKIPDSVRKLLDFYQSLVLS